MTAGGHASKPSDGPRIVDFSTHLSGPIASYLLREFGADVIKIETPGYGDGLRPLKPNIAGVGKYHVGINSGARSLAISSKSPHWRSVVAAAAKWADVVIVGSRPQAARGRGIDFESLRTISPRLVYCALTGFGDGGPWQENAAHGLNPDAWAGTVPFEMVDGMPIIPGHYLSAGTPLAGVFAALGIMAALYRRERGSPAQFVSCSLWGAAMWWNWRDLNLISNTGQARDGYQMLGSRYCPYPTADGRAVIVCPIEEKFWVRFVEAVGLPPEAAQRGIWETAHVDYGYEDEQATIAALTRTKSLEHWIRVLTEADIPFAPFHTAQEAVSSPHSVANMVMRPVTIGETEAQVMASPVRVTTDPDGPVPPRAMDGPPQLGADVKSVLRDFGLVDLM